MRGEDPVQGAGIAQVRLVKLERGPRREAAQALEDDAFEIEEVVDDEEGVPRLGEGDAGMRADVAQAAGDEDVARHYFRILRHQKGVRLDERIERLGLVDAEALRVADAERLQQ